VEAGAAGTSDAAAALHAGAPLAWSLVLAGAVVIASLFPLAAARSKADFIPADLAAHPALRLGYIGAYVANLPPLRSLCWAGAILCTALLYSEGLRGVLGS